MDHNKTKYTVKVTIISSQHYYSTYDYFEYFFYLIEGHPVLSDCPPVDSKNTPLWCFVSVHIFLPPCRPFLCDTHRAARQKKKVMSYALFTARVSGKIVTLWCGG